MATYYIDAETLDAATAVYSNVELTTKAPDGYYRDSGTTYRQQVSGLLQTAEECPYPPATACAASLVSSTTSGVYTTRVNVGEGTGMISIEVNRGTSHEPLNMYAVYNEQPTTQYYCGGLIDGGLVRYTTLPEGCTVPSGGTIEIRTLQNWKWIKTPGTWVDSGNLDIYIDGDEITSVDPSGNNMYLHVYKSDITPTSIEVSLVKACDGDALSIDVSCPTALVSFAASVSHVSSVAACSDATSLTLYHNGVGAEAAIGDFVFEEAGGNYTAVVNGYHKIAGSRYIRVDDGGYVLDVQNC